MSNDGVITVGGKAMDWRFDLHGDAGVVTIGAGYLTARRELDPESVGEIEIDATVAVELADALRRAAHQAGLRSW